MRLSREGAQMSDVNTAYSHNGYKRKYFSQRSDDNRPKANLIEALLLFVCLLMVIAITLSLFANAYIAGSKSARYEEAVTLAANTAERFSADPIGIPLEQVSDGLLVRCDIGLSSNEAGQMYSAYIRVFDASQQIENISAADPIYSLRTARYLSTSGNISDQNTRENSTINRLAILTIQDDVFIEDAELVNSTEGGE